jgi:hypothetical protein
MRKPTPEEAVKCPDSTTNKTYPPDYVYNSPTDPTVVRGILQKHHHRILPNTPDPNPCPWSGHPAPVIYTPKKETPQK